MLMVCVALVFGSKSMQFHIICSFYYSMSINTSEVDPHSDSLHNGIVKPKNNTCCTVCSHIISKESEKPRIFDKNRYSKHTVLDFVDISMLYL